MLPALIEKSLPLLHDSNNGLHDNTFLTDGRHSLRYPISYAASSTKSYNQSLCWLLPAIPIFLPLSFRFSHNNGQPAGSPAILLIQIHPDPSSRSFSLPDKKSLFFLPLSQTAFLHHGRSACAHLFIESPHPYDSPERFSGTGHSGTARRQQ